MSLFKSLLGKKEQPIRTNLDFWTWFQANEKTFFNIVKTGKDIEKGFFDKISPKLSQLKDGFFFLTGMLDDNTAELILTPDGTIKNIVFVEELVESAPSMANWKFTALKTALDIKSVGINMSGYTFRRRQPFILLHRQSRLSR